MDQLTNCPNCGSLFVKNKFRDVCQDCWKEEEKAFEMVYQFIRKRENRTATIQQIVDGTGVDEDVIYKFIKSGRLKTAQFPNLGYPCDKCGRLVQRGKLCEKCSDELRKELAEHNEEERRKNQMQDRKHGAYLSMDER